MISHILKANTKGQTVFTFSDIAKVTGKLPDQKLLSSIHYFVKKGELVRLTKGLYAVNLQYKREELGNRLRTPSYISLYTVMVKKGLIFQYYESIYLVSNRSETRQINGQEFVYHKIKDEILLNPLGLEREGMVVLASAERALLDFVYLFGPQYIDNLDQVDWDKAVRLNQLVYRSKKIDKYIQKSRYVE